LKTISNAKKIITIDRGNTKTSYALHDLEHPVSKIISVDEAYLHHEDALIIASNVSNEEEYGLPIDVNIIEYFKNKKFFDLPVHYSETLGTDRLALAHLIWGYIKEKKHSALIFDVGTFLTCDYVNAEGFQGGFIFPGPFTLMDVYRTGAKLNTFPPEINQTPTPPQSTAEAISRAGGMMIQSMIKEILNYKEVDEIYLTGGACHLISELLPVEKVRENKLFLHRALFGIGKEILSLEKNKKGFE
jgi:pantothenate kinase type III